MIDRKSMAAVRVDAILKLPTVKTRVMTGLVAIVMLATPLARAVCELQCEPDLQATASGPHEPQVSDCHISSAEPTTQPPSAGFRRCTHPDSSDASLGPILEKRSSYPDLDMNLTVPLGSAASMFILRPGPRAEAVRKTPGTSAPLRV